ncbi:hypothetical protein L5D93_18070 [Paenibacillus thiaminolyticus]|nr:hypothetical protein [Paenibacillus thiaminolyticus]
MPKHGVEQISPLPLLQMADRHIPVDSQRSRQLGECKRSNRAIRKEEGEPLFYIFLAIALGFL